MNTYNIKKSTYSMSSIGSVIYNVHVDIINVYVHNQYTYCCSSYKRNLY